MPRVLVCGCSGSGKSTFARKLGNVLGLGVTTLDAYYWQSGWIESNHDAFRERVSPLIAADDWIIDGNYFNPLGELHLPRATHVFFFDLPTFQCLNGVLGRTIKGYGKTRPEMAAVCPERFDLPFLQYVWKYREKQRPGMMQRFQTLRHEQMLTIFSKRAQADAQLIQIAREGLSDAPV